MNDNQETIKRIDKWLGTLEQRIETLLEQPTTDLQPGEREMAIGKHLSSWIKLVELRNQATLSNNPERSENLLLDAIYGADDRIEKKTANTPEKDGENAHNCPA